MEKIKLKIFDKNFYPSCSASPKGTSKHIEWMFVQSDKDLDINDIVVYTDQYLHIAKNHDVRKKIAWILEPPVIHMYPYNYVANNDDFDVVFSFVYDYLKTIKNSYYLPNIMTFIDEHERQIYPKNKKISLIFSNKTRSKNHKYRKEITDFIKKSDLNVDMYGALVNNRIENKLDSLKDYMFHIVVENCNCEGYYSEKTLDCFLTGTVPIIYKNSSIIETYDKNGMIFFNSVNELKTIIYCLTETKYRNMYTFIEHNHKKALEFPVPEDYLYAKYKDLMQ